MLLNLTIKNVALITEAEIEFVNGLNVLSGETGAGKSVILDSLNFVLGAKADKSMIRYGEQFCLVGCTFSNYPNEINDVLNEFDIEISEELIIKRKFDLNGNGYAKVNGENVTLTMLKRITSLLVDVHGQSEHFLLLNKSKQLDVVDDGAKVEEIIAEINKLLSDIKKIDKSLDSMGGNPDERARKIDLLSYQINEIQSAELKEGEEDELKKTKARILNAEKLVQALGHLSSVISDEGGITDLLIDGEHSIKPIASIDERYDEILKRVQLARSEIDEIADEVVDLLDGVESEFIDIDELESRLEVYANFKRKYGATVEEIENYLQSIIAEHEHLVNFDKNSKALIDEKNRLLKIWFDKCIKLSDERKKYCKKFVKNVTEKLSQLGMPNAVFDVHFEELPNFDDVTSPSVGLDKLEFVFSANAGEPVKPLSKIISGGEMSRFMLALKTQTTTGCSTYVFDEIDAGLSGITAGIVAKNFANIANNKQIIAISHLPQITAMSDCSLFIEKIEREGKTYTLIHKLSNEEKRNEILRLIGGSLNDETAQKHAQNMINDADNYKKSI